MAPLEEMHTAMVNRSIRTIKAVCLTTPTVAATTNELFPGTRVPHRFLGHHSSNPLRPSPTPAAADCSPCAYFRGRSSHSSVPGRHSAASSDNCPEQHELTEQRIRRTEQRLRRTEQWLRCQQNHEREERQQLLPAYTRCDTTASTSLRRSSWTSSAGKLPSSRSRHCSLRLHF
jgi:hypothetical protein